MATKRAAKAKTGKRYSPDERKQILEFIESQGRGGISAAQKKFGVSYLSLSRWKKGLYGRKPGRPPKETAGAESTGSGSKSANRALLKWVRAVQKATSALEKALRK